MELYILSETNALEQKTKDGEGGDWNMHSFLDTAAAPVETWQLKSKKQYICHSIIEMVHRTQIPDKDSLTNASNNWRSVVQSGYNEC